MKKTALTEAERTSIIEIIEIAAKLPERDRVRLLGIGEGLVLAQQGKKRVRR